MKKDINQTDRFWDVQFDTAAKARFCPIATRKILTLNIGRRIVRIQAMLCEPYLLVHSWKIILDIYIYIIKFQEQCSNGYLFQVPFGRNYRYGEQSTHGTGHGYVGAAHGYVSMVLGTVPMYSTHRTHHMYPDRYIYIYIILYIQYYVFNNYILLIFYYIIYQL